MSTESLILAAPDIGIEVDLVRGAPGVDLQVIRRPLDAAELLAVASIQASTPIIVSAGLPRMDGGVASLIMRGNRKVIGIAALESDRQQLYQWGVTTVLAAKDAASTLNELSIILGVHGETIPEEPTVEHSHTGVWSTGAWAETVVEANAARELEPQFVEPVVVAQATVIDQKPDEFFRCQGQVIAVWGPQGAPGRSVTAIAIARLLASQGKRVCLIDADTTAPSLTMLEGVVEDASGIVVACRYAQRGSLTPQALMQLCRPLDRNYWMVGGISHPDRWEELDARALQAVLQQSRELFDFTVVDIGYGLASNVDHANLLDSPRFAAASTVIACADAVMAVVQASALGLARLLQQLPVVHGQLHGALSIGIRNTQQGSVQSTMKGLRAYGVPCALLELPTLDPVTVVAKSGLPTRGSFLRRGGHEWRDLEQWCKALDQGEGRTTIKVPTFANL